MSTKMICVSGTVKKIIYQNTDNSFCIFKLKRDSNQDEISVKGTFFKIDENEYLKIYGDYEKSSKYGCTFICDHYESQLPENLNELTKYLGSGLFKGLGKARAQSIVKHFGEKTIDVMENHSERLTEISGIGKRTAELIGESIKERTEIQNVLLKMSRMGIGIAMGKKIWKRYENDSLHILQTNPYRIADEIHGVGFVTMDKIALRNGVEKTAPYRLSSGIKYTLKQLCASGSLYYPQNLLITEAAKVLEVGELEVTIQLKNLLMQEELLLKKKDRIYLPQYYKYELEAAMYLKQINSSKITRKVDQKILQNLGGNLDDIQMGAVKTAVHSNLMILTGGPGVGKTTTTNLIIKYFEKEKKNVILAAPTGRAAKRMMEATGKEATTIHRLLSVIIVNGEMTFEYNEDNWLDGDVFVIDEVSMLDIKLARALFSAIPKGSRLILVGDKNQLPSVGPGNVLADIIASGICPVVELKKIYRQAEGSHIIENAHHVLHGEPLNLSNRSKDFFFKECDNPENIREMLLHYVVDSLPTFTGEKEIQVLSPTRKRYLGIDELNKALQDRMNPLNNRCEANGLREGDKVMQVVNDYSRERKKGKKIETGVFNGDTGIVRKIDDENQYVYVIFDDGWESRFEYKELDCLELAYAISIHKSQGSEYPVIVIPIYDYIPMLTTMNLLYTGITRGKKAILLIGSKKKLYQMVHNVKSNKRYTALAELLNE